MIKKQQPTIGVPCMEIQAKQNRFPLRIGQNQSYVRALVRAGAAPMLIPPLTEKTLLRTLYELSDGLLLPGGEDVDPSSYGEAAHEKCGASSLNRDETELTLTRWAMDDGKPLLAICRGIHVLNVALGGSLYQDIQAQVPEAGRHDWHCGFPRDHLPHAVSVAPQTRLARILGTTSLLVNSLHHQALKDVAPNLTISARAPDRIIEAVEAEDHPFTLAVQWHPEELADNDVRAQRLFDALIKACLKGQAVR